LSLKHSVVSSSPSSHDASSVNADIAADVATSLIGWSSIGYASDLWQNKWVMLEQSCLC